jgi:hypothetical protein
MDQHPLLKKLKVLPEKAMRREALRQRFEEMTAEQVLLFLQEVQNGAARRSRLHLNALDAAHQVIFASTQVGPLYELLAEVYRLARERQMKGVMNLLLNLRPKRGPVEAKDLPQDAQLAHLTLGDRKFQARGHNRNRLARLLTDSDPSVIHNLLQNPSMTETEVINLAARRPTRQEIQREIHASRFGSRYRVQLAIIHNPYTPTDLSLKLVGFLLERDLEAVAHNGSLHDLVREEAARLCQQRRHQEFETAP